ncbi:pyridoxal phosphate-dependent aminotransferase [Clostridium sp. P21]|uniref:cysteine-S-conjugate beta-lyase n=1 Tax=Clostridium muellerianum TaxID=2716538 RepID=A0A7Y0EH51_9CLOT|nr:pyridoxal phosphate-dependent aminotransferase [Clostridium muellerianum]
MTVEEFVHTYYVDRTGTNSSKWDGLKRKFGRSDLLSMWVADMEFKTPQPVIDALAKRIEHGVFGYAEVPDSYYEALDQWMRDHHSYSIKREWVRFTPGIIPALYWFVNMFTKENDGVIVMTPVYYPFLNCVKDTNRKLITCDLDYEDGKFTINYDRFEKMIVDNDVKMYILSSPHNPAGRVWKEEELDKMLGICEKHNVLVISDEIHQDITAPGVKFIPSAAVLGGKYESIIITANAPSKTFNLASFLHANIIIPNPELRAIYDEFSKRYYQAESNLIGITAAEAAYRHGESWRQDLMKVIYSNYDYVKESMKDYPEVTVVPLEGTYLTFIDLRAYVPLDEIREFVQDKCHIGCDYGEWFGENWKGFIRLNIATHPDFVHQAIESIKRELKNYICHAALKERC